MPLNFTVERAMRDDSGDERHGKVLTGRESGSRGEGVRHDAAADTYGQADAGQGNWSERGPAHPAPPSSAADAPRRPLGQGVESRGGSGGPGDRDVKRAPDQQPVGIPPRPPAAEPLIASGLSNYSSTQYANQARYGTPAQYNAERSEGGELQNGDHPEDRPTPGGSGPSHPNG
ncbi:MAG TPA: hypothetical protein VJ847_00290 [Gemmatimonadales bacterium]|jgi:hypothetical protein|nr:hypothetical protein [Gemmatimonadales bacterium]